MNELSEVRGFRVDQSLEVGEILTGFETRNRYDVRTSTYDLVYSAVEEGGSVMLRILLGGWRPIDVTVRSFVGDPVFRVSSSFRLFFHEAEITEADGEPLGTIRRRSGILRRNYEVRDAADGSTYRLTGTLLHPWTFQVARDGARCGRIVKRWNGLFAEAAGDADLIEADFPQEWSARHKALLLGALLLLDWAHFEGRIGHLLDLARTFGT